MNKKNIPVYAGLRTDAEKHEGKLNKKCFDKNTESWEKKMENFPKYVRRQNLTRYMVLYEIFKKILKTKGSIIECGVNQGFGVMSWVKLSSIMEPVNLTRRIYGFDTFEGFPNLSKKDISKQISLKTGLSFLFSKNLTEDIIDIIKELIKYKNLNIKNFGTFKIKKKKERIGRNPKTNEEFIISSRKVISFYGSKKINKKLN